MFKKKYLLLTLFLIIIFQILLYTNNNQKTSFRYFKWTINEVSIGKLISISFFSGLFVSTLFNTTITSTNLRKKTFEKVEDDFESNDNEEEMDQTLRCRHKGILEKLNQQFLLITEWSKILMIIILKKI